MSTYSADRHQHFDDLPDLSDELAVYDTSNYKGRRGGNRGFQRPRNIIIAIVVVVVVALIVCGIAFAMSARQAKNDANQLMTQGKTLVNQLKTGDTAGVEQTTTALSETASQLKNEVSGPLWSIATLFPVYGGDVQAVRALADAADLLCQDALAPIVAAVPAGGLKGILSDGSINVQATVGLLNALDSVRPTIESCADKVDTLGEPHLEQLKSPVETVKSALVTLDALSSHADELAQLLPGMLGANGAPTTYLLTAVNNAEPRPGGGMPGSFGILTVTDGKIEMGGFVGAEAAPRLDAGSGLMPALTDEETWIFGTRVGQDIRDSSFIPDFPRAAELEVALWTATGNAPVDGVIKLDPVFLQQLLALVGGVTTSDGTVVDGTNAAQQLMNEVYLRYPDNNVAQDVFFAEVAGLAFSQVINHLGDVSPMDLLETVTGAIEADRLNIWMANSGYESILVELGAAGNTPESEIDPVAGVYFGASYGTKSGWYLDVQTEVGEGKKNADGSTSYEVTVSFFNQFTENSGLNSYITGGDPLQRVAEDMILDVYLYAPAGGSISDLQTEGEFIDGNTMMTLSGPFHGILSDEPMNKASYNGSELWYGTTRISAQGITKFTYCVTTSSKAVEPLVIDVTPLTQE